MDRYFTYNIFIPAPNLIFIIKKIPFVYEGEFVKITTEMTHGAYSAAKKAYEKVWTKTKAINHLENHYGMSRGSASDYVNNLKLMMEGARYTRTNNIETTKYYLKKISEDYGNESLRNALTAIQKHIEYYESLNHGKLPGIKSILDTYTSLLNTKIELLFPDEIDASDNLIEGAKKTIIVNSYERNAIARKICIEKYGSKCAVCSIDFQHDYGDIGKGFIHVHHLTRLSDIRQGYQINPILDLRPVCPNCHSMLHRKNPPYTIEELRILYKNNYHS